MILVTLNETSSLVPVSYSKELESAPVTDVDNEKVLSLPIVNSSDRVAKFLLARAQGQNLEACRVLVLSLG